MLKDPSTAPAVAAELELVRGGHGLDQPRAHPLADLGRRPETRISTRRNQAVSTETVTIQKLGAQSDSIANGTDGPVWCPSRCRAKQCHRASRARAR